MVRPFVQEYLSGRTPIPCSLCNNHLKFDQLLITARQIGAEMLATGHYARVEYDAASERWLLKRPADRAKDQTYFLFGLTQEQLSRTLFPLGGMRKPEVRELAKQHGLALAEKPDSQEICFVPGGDYKKFIDAYLAEQGEALPDTAGELVTTDGRSSRNAPRHSQLHRRTAQGLGCCDRIAFVRSADPRRPSRGGRRQRGRALLEDDARSQAELDCRGAADGADARRYKNSSSPRACARNRSADGEDYVSVIFDQPQRAITPGQAAVFYDGDTVVGGGWIA